MANSKSKTGMLGILMGVLILGLCAMTLAGIFIDEWTVINAETFLGSGKESVSFEDYKDSVADSEGKIDFGGILENFDADDNTSLKSTMVVFGYIAVAVVCLLTLLYLLKMLLNVGLFRFVTGIVGICALVAGAVLIGVTASYCDKFLLNFSIGEVAKAEMAVGLGAYLTSIGAMGVGVAAVIGCAKK